MNFSKFFSNLQESPWYRSFLNPVIEEIDANGKLLDIGTGSGKLIQILIDEKGTDCIGVDTNSDMLAEAKIKLRNVKAELIEITSNTKLPFENNSFEFITICNVLFHMKRTEIDRMLKDAIGLLNESGKIIILTPTGNGNVLKLTRHFFSFKNWSIYIWYRATKNRGKIWTNENYMVDFALREKLKYKRELVMNGFAQVEIITR